MAVPFLIQEDAEDCYRSLDFLLEQLLITLRQVMTLRRREAVSNAHTIRQHRHIPVETRTVENRTSELIVDSGTATATTTITSTPTQSNDRIDRAIVESTRDLAHSINFLPDVVLDATSATQEQKETERTGNVETMESTAQTQDWVQVGADLKRIADQLVAANRLDQMSERKGEKEKISLLSQFCPPLGSPVWTTVAILVGWGLLSRTR